MPKSPNPVGPATAWAVQQSDVRKGVPQPSPPRCALARGADTPKSRVSAKGETSDQLLQQTARSNAASSPHTLEVWKVLPTREEGADALPRATLAPSPFQRGISCCRDFGAGGTLRVGSMALAAGPPPWPRDQLPALPSFSKLLRPTSPSPSPSPLRQLLSYLSPGNTWLRGFQERSFLGAYSLTWEERGTKRQKGGPKPASERLPARAAGSRRGWQPERAPQSSGGPAGVRRCLGPLPAAPLSAGPAAVLSGCPLVRHCGALPLAAW